jgi:hypothetical protein
VALFHSPSIVTSGLVLCLDAGNTKSYPGSGTTWTDLVQGIAFSSFGTQTPVEVVNGATSFAFNNSGYWQSTSGHENVDMGGDCTLLMWIYAENVTTRKTIFEKAPTIYNSYEQEIAVTWEVDETFSWYSRYNTYDYGLTPAISQNKWSLVGIKMSSGRTASARTGFYSINGGNWISNYTSRSSTSLVSSGALRVGNGYAGVVENGNISMVMCYNKMLSDNEIQQNYNALKSRFGLT